MSALTKLRLIIWARICTLHGLHSYKRPPTINAPTTINPYDLSVYLIPPPDNFALNKLANTKPYFIPVDFWIKFRQQLTPMRYTICHTAMLFCFTWIWAFVT